MFYYKLDFYSTLYLKEANLKEKGTSVCEISVSQSFRAATVYWRMVKIVLVFFVPLFEEERVYCFAGCLSVEQSECP